MRFYLMRTRELNRIYAEMSDLFGLLLKHLWAYITLVKGRRERIIGIGKGA